MKILVLPGDGIGPEITEATLAVLDRANAKFKLGLDWQKEEIGLGPLKKRGSTLPEDVMEARDLIKGRAGVMACCTTALVTPSAQLTVVKKP